MKLLPFVAAFSTICFVWSYGIQKRRWWAWYAGWVFSALAAVVIVYLLWITLFYSGSWEQMAINALTPGGGACVWIFWARWWAAHRGEFYPSERRGKRGTGDDPNEWEK